MQLKPYLRRYIIKKPIHIDKLIIRLKNKFSVKSNRSKHPQLAARYPEYVIIESVSISTT